MVTVFPSGAEVTRVADEVKLDGGEHMIIFNDVPAFAIPGSIRVEGKATGKLEIGSVDSRRLFVPRTDSAVAEDRAAQARGRDRAPARRARRVSKRKFRAPRRRRSLIANLAQLPTRPAPATGAERGEDWPQILALIASGSREAQTRSR